MSRLDGRRPIYSFKYDPSGHRIYKSSSSGTSIYAYDGDELIELNVYDAVGNRLSDLGSASWTYNTSNELNARPTVNYTYDNNGNTLTSVGSAGTTKYAWDFENRLSSERVSMRATAIR